MTIVYYIPDKAYTSDKEHIESMDAKRVSVANNIIGDISYDTITAEYPSTTVEIYRFRTGGLLGTINASVTVTYTDATKDLISSAVRS